MGGTYHEKGFLSTRCIVLSKIMDVSNPYLPLSKAISVYWLVEMKKHSAPWEERQNSRMVMPATSLTPDNHLSAT